MTKIVVTPDEFDFVQKHNLLTVPAGALRQGEIFTLADTEAREWVHKAHKILPGGVVALSDDATVLSCQQVFVSTNFDHRAPGDVVRKNGKYYRIAWGGRAAELVPVQRYFTFEQLALQRGYEGLVAVKLSEDEYTLALQTGVVEVNCAFQPTAVHLISPTRQAVYEVTYSLSLSATARTATFDDSKWQNVSQLAGGALRLAPCKWNNGNQWRVMAGGLPVGPSKKMLNFGSVSDAEWALVQARGYLIRPHTPGANYVGMLAKINYGQQSVILRIVDADGERYTFDSAQPTPPAVPLWQSACAIAEENAQALRSRATVGRQKYGVSLGDAKLDTAALLQHLREEMLDGANYALAALQQLQKRL